MLDHETGAVSIGRPWKASRLRRLHAPSLLLLALLLVARILRSGRILTILNWSVLLLISWG